MTGFARAQGQTGGVAWTWEVRSVNGKGLDIRCRLPGGLEGLEPRVREQVGRTLRRGNVTMTLTMTRTDIVTGMRVNREILEQVLALAAEVRGCHPEIAPPALDGLLALRGVVEPLEAEETEEARQALETAVLSSLDEALKALAATRLAEGARLHATLAGHVDRIAGLTAEAGRLASLQPEAIKARLKQQVDELLAAAPGLPADRLAQEAALLVTRADVREELDRLHAHVEAARDLLAANDAVGRRLDFLCQEFTREANTLCSKSADTELTRIGLELKVAIEQFREQVQNVE
jgi:uncharacterized protein (TIGR00255 family)